LKREDWAVDGPDFVLQLGAVMTPSQPVRQEFQAEVRQLLDLMVHSLYSNKEIFLRELISNASDALDKLRFARLTSPGLAEAGELAVRIDVDRAARTLTVSDNGIGMTRDEVIRNIGTIAKSGTKEFLSAMKAAQASNTSEQGGPLPPELIGQFGVGFYSVFMVADKVTLETRKAGEDASTAWQSEGDGTYTLDEGTRPQAGTTITLHLKPTDEEHGLRDFTDEAVIRDIVKKYSDFVAYPVRMKVWRKAGTGEGSSETQVFEDATLNSQKAIWDRPQSEVSETEYHDFYRHLAHDWHPPLRTIPVKMEGTLEAYALLYLPTRAPFDLYSPEMKRGLQLYVKRVFVMDECRDLMPAYLRFVKGVVDAHDLPLNVSREILQKDRKLQIIRKQLVKKVLAALDEMKRDKREDYLTLWGEMGPVLKEGLLNAEPGDKDKLMELLLADSTFKGEAKTETTKDEAAASDGNAPAGLTSLADYVARMKEGQDAIYFLTGPSKEALAKSPLLEAFAAKGYEVLLFSDPVDELWLERAPHFQDKPLKSVGKGEVKLGSDEERKKEEAVREAKEQEYRDFLTCFRVLLADEIKEARLSSRLTESPVCLVTDDDDMTPQMQKLMEQLGHKAGKIKRILEVNADHPLVTKLRQVFASDAKDPRLAMYAQLLLGQAHLAESGQVPDPTSFSKVLAEVMTRGL
jgi:molecular chaperone HtpG